MTCDLSHAVYAARKHCANQRAAGETVHPALHGFLCTRKGFRCVLCRRCKQIGFRKGVVRIEQRVGAVQHGLELTADAVIVDRRCEHQHICIVHFGGNFHGIVLDDAVPQLQAGEAALAKANLLFPQINGFYLMARRLCALGKRCRQRFGVAALTGAGRYNQNSLAHSKLLFLLKIFVFLLY